MLQKVMTDLKGDRIVARDGALGSVKDVYFDDERWAVRYLVVDTGTWLPGRRVLISPVSLSEERGAPDELHVALTREQVKHAPDTADDPPVSRLFELAHARHYGHPRYWVGPYLWGVAPVPLAAAPAEEPQHVSDEIAVQARKRAEGSHLRSGAEVVGYHIVATDGEIGHVEDFVVDDETWAICDMVVETRNWLPGARVLIPPDTIAHIDWREKEVRVRLTRAELKQAPGAD